MQSGSDMIDAGKATFHKAWGVVGWAVAIVGGFLVARALDYPVWRAFHEMPYDENDRMRLFKAAGYYPAWALAATALLLCDWPRRVTQGVHAALNRAALLLVAPALGALAAEVLKILIRRERPPAHPQWWDGEHLYRAYLEKPFDAGGLSLPSSHTTVAFAGAWMLCYLFPRATPVWLLLACGCGYSRMADHAHFFSDVYASAVVGGMIVMALVIHDRATVGQRLPKVTC